MGDAEFEDNFRNNALELPADSTNKDAAFNYKWVQ